MKEFVKLVKAHKEREFFEKLTDAELDTFAKALKMKLPDSRENKLKVIIAYSKKDIVAQLAIQMGYMGIFAASAIALYMYAVHLEKECQRYDEDESKPPRVKQTEMKIISMVLGLAVPSLIPTAVLKYKTFQRFTKALRALK